LPPTPRLLARAALAIALVWLAAGLGDARAQAEAAPALVSPPRPDGEPVKVLVAVLPFQVHSTGGVEYLESALVDLLTTRLEASGRVQVVDSVVVREAIVDHAAGELAESELRRIAREVDADYVVAGSLTELAGRYSLDVRVTPVEAAFTSKTMVFTADGEDELLDRVNELAERVVAVVTEAPSVTVAEVRLVGAEDRTGGVAAMLGTQPGRPYASSAVRADLEALRALPGIAAATAETERAPQGVIVTFKLVESEALLAEPRAEEGEQVAEVRVRGNKRIETDAILARISTRAGTPYSARRVASDLREVHSLGFFRNVRVVSEDGPQGRILVFEVEENPVVRQVTISGNDAIDGDKIRDTLTLTTGSTLDYPLLHENAQRIQALYRAEGFYLASVSHSLEELSGNAVAVHFEVNENEKLRLREINFEGNTALTDDELRRGFKTKPWRFWSHVTRFLDNSGTYSEPVFQQDLRSVEQKYADAGYVQVELADPRVDPTPEGLLVTVDVREGDLFHVGKLDVAGDPTADVDALREQLKLKQGEVFNRSALTADVDALEHHYTDRGFYFAGVDPVTRVSTDDKLVDVTFRVEKGPLYFVRTIDFEGNTQTIDPVLRREMQLVEGQLYSARALQLSEARLRSLGFFEEVVFEPKPTDQADQIDVDVKVVERPTGSLSFGAGFSSEDGFIVTGSLSQSNLFGRGYGAQLAVDWGGRSKRLFGSFTDPYVFGSNFSFAATVYADDLEYEDFDQTEQGIDLVLGHALDLEGRTRGFLRYGFATRDIDEDETSNAASVIFRQILHGELSTSLFGLTLRGDTRNDRVAPTKGGQWAASADLAGFGGFSQFARLEGRIQRFYPAPEWWPVFPGRSTFMFAARAGWAVPFNDISDYDAPTTTAIFDPGANIAGLEDIDTDLTLPLSERYFLGGIGPFQLRGFRARSVGPRRAVLRRTGLFGTGSEFLPVGRTLAIGPGGGLDAVCDDVFAFNQGDLDGECNDIDDEQIDDFEDLDETDVVGGNKFLSLTAEYRFPISEALGLMGIVFFDTGNAFAENDQIWDVGEWRYGSGLGVLWFSPFGPLQAFVGFPLDALEVEESQVFEFSVGGAGF
jgi:outer membrane protein insertion porin family